LFKAKETQIGYHHGSALKSTNTLSPQRLVGWLI